MSNKVTTAKLKAFRNKIHKITEQELALRKEVKALYEQLVLDAGDEKIALRQVRQAYYRIQKHRIIKLLEDRLEFHPFFTANPFKAEDMFDEVDEEDDEF